MASDRRPARDHEPWPALSYRDWGPCCDTVHALTQILGKLAVVTAPPQPELHHTGLLLTTRGWETAPLPAPDGSGTFSATLDMRASVIRIEHSARDAVEVGVERRPVADIYAEVLTAVNRLAGDVTLDPTPQEVSWTVGLDVDDQHRDYDAGQVGVYFAAATQAALVLSAFRAPFRGRLTPVLAWWGSFDLAVNLFSGRPATPPDDSYIMRNAMDAEEVAVGWWPGDAKTPGAAFYAYAHPAPDDYSKARLEPAAARWDAGLGEFVLDWDAVRTAADPHAEALSFARSAFAHSCSVCGWPSELSQTIGQDPLR